MHLNASLIVFNCLAVHAIDAAKCIALCRRLVRTPRLFGRRILSPVPVAFAAGICGLNGVHWMRAAVDVSALDRLSITNGQL